MKKQNRSLKGKENTLNHGRPVPVFEIKNEANDGPVEILIYDVIGKDPWTGEGMSANDFVQQLSALDKTRDLDLRVNSRGGSVDEGITIYNRLKAWEGNTRAFVDGSAASIASVIIMGADEVHIPKSGEILIHDAWGFGMGNAEDMRELAQHLDIESDRIANIYSERTGKPAAEFRDLMRKTTIMLGEQAKAIGLADVITDQKPAYNLTPEDINYFKAATRKGEQVTLKPVTQAAATTLPAGAGDHTQAASKSGGDNNQPNNIMDKTKILAMLRKHDIAIEDAATDEQIEAALNKLAERTQAKADTAPDNKQLNDTLAAIQAEHKRLIEARVRGDLSALVKENRMTQAQADTWLPRVIADEAILNDLRQWPAIPVKDADPVDIVITSESVQDIDKGFNALRSPIKSMLQGNDVEPSVLAKNAKAIYALIDKNAKKILNANTISADLQRNVILFQSGMRAFKRRLVALSIFSTRFNNVPLEGTAKIAVPYYPLHTTTSNDFSDGTGYEFDHGTDTQDKDVTINKRKYQPFNFYSHQLSRQPAFNTMQLMALKSEQLAVDVWTDVLSAITLANFGAAVKTEAAAGFDSDDVIDIGGACDEADWPDVGRSLVLLTSYHTSLKKDPDLKHADASGGTQTLREGSTGRVDRFDIYQSPRFPGNSQNLVGVAVLPSALLVATSPIQPGPGVRQQLVSYDVITDPDTGISFEYRFWGDPDQDEEREIVEVNYGYNAGEAAACKRITSA